MSRLSAEWSEDDYDVLADGMVVGRIMKAVASPVGTPWLWTLAYGYHEDRTPIHDYEAMREAARHLTNWLQHNTELTERPSHHVHDSLIAARCR
jgi:hypothetical protein